MDFLNFDYTLLIRLLAALLLGGIIGLERGGHNHEAGLRTHMLLCLGSALTMVISICICKEYNIHSEVLRMSAQVLSGIGFLGAGSIIATGKKIKGITTAAGLWATACVGIAVGAGYYIPAAFAVLCMLFVMLCLKSFTKKIRTNKSVHHFEIEINNKIVLESVLMGLKKYDCEILNIRIDDKNDNNISVELTIKVSGKINAFNITEELLKIDGVNGFLLLD